MVTSWGAHSEIVESSLREPRNYFELIYHTAKMLWEKWQNHLFAACCWNAGLVWITHAKRALCCEPALLREICFSLLCSSLVGLPCRGPSSEIAFCVITFVDIHKIWIQMGFFPGPCWAVTLLSHQENEGLSCLQGGPLTAWQSSPSRALLRERVLFISEKW